MAPPASRRPWASVSCGPIRSDSRKRKPRCEALGQPRTWCATATSAAAPALALVRCLYWQTRYEEAAVEALALVASSRHDGITVEAWALLARVRAAMGDVRAALAAAAEATNRVGGVAPRIAATACRSMALAQRLVGDEEQVRAWSDRALRLAASGHLPLLGLRARCLLVSSLRPTCRSHATDGRAARWFGHLRTALARRPLPALLRRELEIVCARAAETGPGISSTHAGRSAARDRGPPGDGPHRARRRRGHQCGLSARLRAPARGVRTSRQRSRRTADARACRQALARRLAHCHSCAGRGIERRRSECLRLP